MKSRIKYRDTDGNILYKADNCKAVRKAHENNDIELTTLARGSYPGKKLNKNELKGIKSIGYWNIRKLQDWGLDWHTNEGIEICFLESGNLTFAINDEAYDLSPNNLTITRPWIKHKLGNPEVELSKLYWFILDIGVRHPHQEWDWPDWIILNKQDLVMLTKYLRQNEQPVWNAIPEMKEYFNQIGKVIRKSDQNPYDSKLKGLINMLLISLLEHFRVGNVTLDMKLINTKRTVELFLISLQDMYLEFWTVNEMAAYCKLGTTQFTKYCKEISNCTPIEYLQRIRLRQSSKMLLSEPDRSVTDIAYSCGFSSAQYFSTVFKKHFRKTPQAFKQKESRTS